MFLESGGSRILFHALARLYFHVASLLPRLIPYDAYLAAYSLVWAGAELQVHHLGYFL